MRILIVMPRYTLSKKKDFLYEMPLGLSYISAMLKKQGYSVDCVNLNHLNGSTEDLMGNILHSKEYNYVLTGGFGVSYIAVEKIINTSRQLNKSAKIIVGGPMITSEPALMAESLNFDYGVIGEGELTIVELIKKLEEGKNIESVNGLVYRGSNGRAVFTKSRESIKNLDSLPFPDLESFGFMDKLSFSPAGYSLYGTMDYPRTYPLLGSRGCPFQCTFCYHTVGGNYRIRSVKNIIEEIKFAIKKFNINSFSLLDDLFASNKVRLKEFCDELKKVIKDFPGEFKWVCSLWVTSVDEETINMLKDANCSCIGFGFESYSPTVLKSMKKHITPEQIDNAIKTCRKLKMPFVGNFIFGDIAETKQTAKETLDYWKKNCRGQVKLFFIHPYPNSEIYQHCVKKGIIKDRLDFIKNEMGHTRIINMTNGMTDGEFEQLKKEIYNAKLKYENYVIPFKVKKTKHKKIFNMFVKCLSCKKISVHKNFYTPNRFFFRDHLHCKNCAFRYHVVSRLYKFITKHYVELDFIRKNFLFLRDRILKKLI